MDKLKPLYAKYFPLSRAVRAPLVPLAVYILLLIFVQITPPVNGNPYLVACMLQITAILLPTLLYIKLREPSFAQAVVSAPRGSILKASRTARVILSFTLLLAMIFGSLLVRLTLFKIGALSRGASEFSSYSPQAENALAPLSRIGAIAAFAFLPAICEELLFRGVLCEEYSPYGAPCMVVATSLLFSMMHMSLPLLPVYILCGALLGMSRYLTGSLFVPITLHFFYNLFVLTFEGQIWNIIGNAKNVTLFALFSGIIFFVSLIIALRAGESLLRAHPARPKPTVSKRFSAALLSISFLACVVAFFVAAIIRLAA